MDILIILSFFTLINNVERSILEYTCLSKYASTFLEYIYRIAGMKDIFSLVKLR